jgi:hypothetical protein
MLTDNPSSPNAALPSSLTSAAPPSRTLIPTALTPSSPRGTADGRRVDAAVRGVLEAAPPTVGGKKASSGLGSPAALEMLFVRLVRREEVMLDGLSCTKPLEMTVEGGEVFDGRLVAEETGAAENMVAGRGRGWLSSAMRAKAF